jgi:uncharacterized coiled-coil DUF342 family protein
MPKSTVRPPRTPKGEDPKVTIANMRRTCDMLVARVQHLVKERDDALASLRSARDAIDTHKSCGDALRSEIEALNKKLANADKAIVRYMGWQDCAREVFDSIG